MFGARFGKTWVTDCTNAACTQVIHEHIHPPRNSKQRHVVELVAFEYVVLDKIIAVVNASGLFAWFWIVINNKNSVYIYIYYIYSVKVFTRKYAWRHQPNDSFS